MTAVSVVVVTYNSERWLGRCLDSALAQAAEVIVVDNASQDGTVAEARRRPAVRVIANPWNRGFAAAVNQGCQAARHPHVLLLNPDAELLDGLDAMAEACTGNVAAVTGQLLGEGDQPQAGFNVRRLPTPAALVFELLGWNRLWPRNPVNRRYRCLDVDLSARGETEQPAGAFLLLSREAWQRLGGLDEQFAPVWFEDVDLCRRLLSSGHRILFIPEASARHAGGHSLTFVMWWDRQLYWYDSLLRYAAKHFGPTARRAVCAAVILGSAFRTVSGILLLKSRQPVTVFGAVFRRAGFCLLTGRC